MPASLPSPISSPPLHNTVSRLKQLFSSVLARSRGNLEFLTGLLRIPIPGIDSGCGSADVFIDSSTPLVCDTAIATSQMKITKEYISYPQKPQNPFPAAVLRLNIVFSSASSRGFRANMKIRFLPQEGFSHEYAPIIKGLDHYSSPFEDADVDTPENLGIVNVCS
ncbi:hypothetical protein BT69DRAFT_715728 [Atractiella rhizophila]|nr:hypothetical protein BT69DRAFT_715728 [Atractiella rhizophila]